MPKIAWLRSFSSDPRDMDTLGFEPCVRRAVMPLSNDEPCRHAVVLSPRSSHRCEKPASDRQCCERL